MASAISAADVNRAFDAGVMGAAQIYPEDEYVFMRARAGGGHRTPYGLFVFDRAKGEWLTLGTAAHFSNPVPWKGNTIDPETLFYSRSGYENIQLGSNTYEIRWDQGRAVVNVTGIEPAQYTSDNIPEPGGGTREYLFKYVQGTRLWFDMRVKTSGMLYSEGIGCFDASDKSFTIYSTQQLGFEKERTIITRMTGSGDRVILGVSFCDTDTCLNKGGFIMVPRQGDPVLYNAENARLPGGAVLDIVPDADLFWVATAHGVTQWKPGMQTNSIYHLTATALVFGSAPLTLWSDGTPAVGKEIPDKTTVTIIRAINLGFVTTAPYPVTGWTSKDHATKGLYISDDGAELVVEPGNKISFYSGPAADASFMGDIQSMDEIPRIKILENQGDWIHVELTQNVWIPARNIILYMGPVE